MLKLVQLGKFAKRKPHQLSGGQQQRVALARSLAKRPQLLLLDEPLGALDKKLREETQIELVNIIEEVGVTCVMVTHDQEEAMTMASRIAVMSEGRVLQVGRAERHLRDAGHALRGRLHRQRQPDGRHAGRGRARPLRDRLRTTAATTSATASPAPQGMAVTVAVRPEKIRLSRQAPRRRATRRRASTARKGAVQEPVLLRQLHRLPPRAAPAAGCSRSARTTPSATADDELTWGDEAWATGRASRRWC